MSGRVIFTPRRRSVPIEGVMCLFSPIYAELADGVLVHNGTPGISLPASLFGLWWGVKILPIGFSTVLQSYPGDIISLGD